MIWKRSNIASWKQLHSPYKIQWKISKNKKSYAMGDGAGGYVVEGARQPTLPHRRGNVHQRRRDRRRRQARLLAAGLDGLPHLLEEGRWTIVDNMRHRKERKKINQTEKERKMSKSKKKREKEKQKSR